MKQQKQQPVVEIGMTLVIPLDRYERIGRLMDRIDGTVSTLLADEDSEGAFDFTSFNTHPCKGAVIRERMYQRERMGMDTMPEVADSPMPSLAQNTVAPSESF